MQLEELEQLLHGDLPAFEFVHDTVGIHAVRPLDEAQQVLLVHASCGVDVSVDLEWQRSGTELFGLSCVRPLVDHKRALNTERHQTKLRFTGLEFPVSSFRPHECI